MAVYQQRAKERIRKNLRRIGLIVDKGTKEDFKEADTRKIVTGVLTECLGWDEFENLTAEQMINSRYADFVLKKAGEQIAVIEVKQIGLKLKDAHLYQASGYAVKEGIEWIILTNGDMWKVYRVCFKNNIPSEKLVLSFSFSDDKMKPAEKTELLYLLSEEAYRKRELEDYYDRRIALSGENLTDHLLSEDVLNKLRISIKTSTGQNFANSELASALVEKVFQAPLSSDDFEKAIKRLQRAEKQKAKAKEDKESPEEENFK